MSDFERYAVQRLLDQAAAVGVDVSGMSAGSMCNPGGSTGARQWSRLHPDADPVGCCMGEALDGPEGCTCWRPVYEVDQAEPRPPQCNEDLLVQVRMCGDCAFRKDSPERADKWSEDALFDLARGGKPFWCHQGMRRPIRHVHPDGRVVDGDTADWNPPSVQGIPYQADGSPGLLCAGWMAHAVRAHVEVLGGG